jgi:hypothetical protein
MNESKQKAIHHALNGRVAVGLLAVGLLPVSGLAVADTPAYEPHPIVLTETLVTHKRAGWGRGVWVGSPVALEWADRVGSGFLQNRYIRTCSSRDRLATIGEQHGTEAPEFPGWMGMQPIVCGCPQISIDLLVSSSRIPPGGSDHDPVMQALRAALQTASSLHQPTAP